MSSNLGNRLSGDRSPSGQAWSRAALGMVLLGTALRLVQWLGNPSLWLDELMLVKNLRERGVIGLTARGLDYDQVAPGGYLVLTKATTFVFGEGERALRLVPVAASILALVFCWRLARAFFKARGAFVATAGFALNPLLISLSAAVKQYSTDALATVLILLAMHRLQDPKGSLRSRVLVGVGAGAIGLLSIPSVLVALSAIAALLYGAWTSGGLRSPDSRARVLAPLLGWALVAGGAALLARGVLTLETHEFQREYWAGRDAFAPPFMTYPTWVFDRLANQILPGFFWRPYASSSGGLGAVLRPLLGLGTLAGALLLSILALVRQGGLSRITAILLPCFLALLLSRFEVYPLEARTSVFLLPLLLLLVGALTSLLVQVFPRSIPRVREAICLLPVLAFVTILADKPPIYVVQREREVVRELSLRRGQGEPVFAYAFSEWALDYYGARFGLSGPILLSRHGRDGLSQLESFRGNRSLWVLFTHADAQERDYFLCYLDEIGRESEDLVLPGGLRRNPVSLHRYDLSDATRGSSTRASDFPMTDEAFEGPSPRCRRRTWADGGQDTPRPMAPSA